MTVIRSVFDGVSPLVDEWLQLSNHGKPPQYRHRAAALELSERSNVASAGPFIRAAYSQIEKNWKESLDANRYSKSKENWRFNKRTNISPKNKSPEINLERAIVRGADSNWANQVPTSSGLVGANSDTTRNIDLVCRDGSENFSLIELKYKSDNPLYAAIEIFFNGLLLAWSRNNMGPLGYSSSEQPLLSAVSLRLSILAPSGYYDGFDLSPLSIAMEQGLRSCNDLLGLPVTFCFTRFPKDFVLEGDDEKLYRYAIKRELL